MNDTEVYELENRAYVNPTQSRDEQLQFIDNLRATQEQANQQIAEDTYALGTQVPTNLGGLTSGAGNADSYWASRYQTPQVASQIANLQATAQADALSKILAQDQSVYQNRANQAYRSYSKRKAARDKAAAEAVTKGNTPATSNPEYPDVETKASDDLTTVDVKTGTSLDTSEWSSPVSIVGVPGAGGSFGDTYQITDLVTGEIVQYDKNGNEISRRPAPKTGGGTW